jgi:hypothetical protein
MNLPSTKLVNTLAVVMLLAACGGEDSTLPGSLNVVGAGAQPVVVSSTATLVLFKRYVNATVTGLYLSHASSPGTSARLEKIPCADDCDLRLSVTLGQALLMTGVRFDCGSTTTLTVP